MSGDATFRLIKEMMNSPAVTAAQAFAESPAMVTAREMMNSPAVLAAFAGSPTARLVLEMMNSPAVLAAQAFAESPAMVTAREMMNSPAVLAAREFRASSAMRLVECLSQSTALSVAEALGETAAMTLAKAMSQLPPLELVDAVGLSTSTRVAEIVDESPELIKELFDFAAAEATESGMPPASPTLINDMASMGYVIQNWLLQPNRKIRVAGIVCVATVLWFFNLQTYDPKVAETFKEAFWGLIFLIVNLIYQEKDKG